MSPSILRQAVVHSPLLFAALYSFYFKQYIDSSYFTHVKLKVYHCRELDFLLGVKLSQNNLFNHFYWSRKSNVLFLQFKYAFFCNIEVEYLYMSLTAHKYYSSLPYKSKKHIINKICSLRTIINKSAISRSFHNFKLFSIYVIVKNLKEKDSFYQTLILLEPRQTFHRLQFAGYTFKVNFFNS